jgi:hypothetical protein
VREHSRQPANTRINKERIAELRYTGRALFNRAENRDWGVGRIEPRSSGGSPEKKKKKKVLKENKPT